MDYHQQRIAAALKSLPHRYPFVFVDGVIDYDLEHRRITSFKNVSLNEPYFQGHFPDNPIMPGVLILEGMAQSAAVFHFLEESNEGNDIYLAGTDKLRFKKKVFPGDRLIFKLQELQKKRGVVKIEAKAFVKDELVAKGELLAAFSKKSIVIE